MNVTFIQTSDAIFYYPMLQQTAKTVREYCIRNGFSYEQFVGIKRGTMPWHAAYNRIYMLKELVDRGVEGWVFYLDADAMITDLSFDLRDYLRDKDRYGAIFAGYINEVIWDINSGGFAVNLSHPAGQGLIIDYYRALQNIPKPPFEESVHWERDLINDQHMLYLILQHYVSDLGFGDSYLFERTNQSHVNNGPFISQQIRHFHNSFEDRLEYIRCAVQEILSGNCDSRSGRGPGLYIPAEHPRLRTEHGRKTVFGIEGGAAGDNLLQGPRSFLAPGDHVVRIFGELRTPSETAPIMVHIEAIVDDSTVIASRRFDWRQGAKGLLLEFAISLDTETHDFAIRLQLQSDADLCIHALQIS
jgi:hypothetical protein